MPDILCKTNSTMRLTGGAIDIGSRHNQDCQQAQSRPMKVEQDLCKLNDMILDSREQYVSSRNNQRGIKLASCFLKSGESSPREILPKLSREILLPAHSLSAQEVGGTNKA